MQMAAIITYLWTQATLQEWDPNEGSAPSSLHQHHSFLQWS